MSDKEEIRSVTDSSVPNAGRIYDYILGGNYNFEVDRKIADELLKKLPIIKDNSQLVRWFLGNAVDRSFKMGITQFVDFASGLPTVDHIHTRIPEEVKEKAKILYSDIDPFTVQIGKNIIGENPSVKFVECDCRKPESLLDSDIVKNFFNIKQKFTLGLNGILYFLTDEQINHTTNVLYEWAPVGSIIYFSDYDSEHIKDNPKIQEVFAYYKNIKQPLFVRPKEKLKELIKPWKIKDPGLQIVEKWLEINIDTSAQSHKKYGSAVYGGFLEK